MLSSINKIEGDFPLLIKDKNGNTRIVFKRELTKEMTVLKELKKTVMTKNDLNIG